MPWNRSHTEPKAEIQKQCRKKRLKYIFCVGILSLGVSLFLIFSNMISKNEKLPEIENKDVVKKKKIKSVKIAVKDVTSNIETNTIRKTAKGTPIPKNVHPDSHGVMRYPNGQRWVDRNDLKPLKHPQKRKLFKRTCDNQIATILTLDPSKMAPFLRGKRRPYDERFIEDFKNSLGDDYQTDPNDTEEEAIIRQMVIETRKELKTAMDSGEDISKLMNETQDELDRLCQYRNQLSKELNVIKNDGSYTDEDFIDYVKAANELLKKQGLKEFTLPNVISRQAYLLKLKELRERQTNEN